MTDEEYCQVWREANRDPDVQVADRAFLEAHARGDGESVLVWGARLDAALARHGIRPNGDITVH